MRDNFPLGRIPSRSVGRCRLRVRAEYGLEVRLGTTDRLQAELLVERLDELGREELRNRRFEVDVLGAVISADDVDGPGKAAPDGFEYAADELDVPIQACVVVEDSPEELREAVRELPVDGQ